MKRASRIDIEAARAGLPIAEYIVDLLNGYGGVEEAATVIGINPRTLYYHMRKCGIGSETTYFIIPANEHLNEAVQE